MENVENIENDSKEISVGNDVEEICVDVDDEQFEVVSEETSHDVENVDFPDPDDDCNDIISGIVLDVVDEKIKNEDTCITHCISPKIINVVSNNEKSEGEIEEQISPSLPQETSKISIPCDHGYCKSPSVESTTALLQDSIKLDEKQQSNDEAPIPKKMKLNLGMPSQQNTTTLNTDIQKQRMDPCPPLNKEHIDLLLTYLANPKLCITEQLFLMQLKLSNFPRIKRYSVSRQLERWSKCLIKRKVNGQVTLCLRLSEKIILPKEKYATIIRDAHENVGYFLNKEETKKEKSRKCDHNSYHKTFTMIESEYGVGGREFGMSKYRIYEHVANCRNCSTHQKRLPSLSKVLGSSEIPKNMASRYYENGVFEEGMIHNSIDDDEGADDADAPISMVWEKPSPGSIWHNQQGLASEENQYAKLLGVIQEVGLDLIASVQGDVPSKSKFLTKLYCATRLIQEMRIVCERGGTNADAQFMIDYLKLQDTYVEIGQLDLFLYDVNLLAIKYNLTKSELFMQMVNNCVSKFSKINKPITEQSTFDTPIDLVDIDTT